MSHLDLHVHSCPGPCERQEQTCLISWKEGSALLLGSATEMKVTLMRTWVVTGCLKPVLYARIIVQMVISITIKKLKFNLRAV